MKYVNQKKYPDLTYVTRANPEDPKHELGKRTTVSSAGCALCSAVMVADRLLPNTEFFLEDAMAISYEAGANRSAGTSRKFFPAFGEKMGFRFRFGSTTDELKECLQTGGAAMVTVSEVKGEHPGLFTHGGHVMAIIGVEPDGRFAILDPSYLPGKFDEEGRRGKVEIKNDVILLCEPEVLQEETRARQPGAYFLYWRK
ncbi:MAG: hypothetical protein E7580_07195 [Ruminococcaceae bacterium]|nr:hypothetical protein [Oscillospiraceae bacterium]